MKYGEILPNEIKVRTFSKSTVSSRIYLGNRNVYITDIIDIYH